MGLLSANGKIIILVSFVVSLGVSMMSAIPRYSLTV